MALRAKGRETITTTDELRRTVEEAFRVSMHTDLNVVRRLCLLAEQENGKKRAHHVRLAEKAFASALELASRVELNQDDREAIERAQDNIHQLG